jgi:hypothetical protein
MDVPVILQPNQLIRCRVCKSEYVFNPTELVPELVFQSEDCEQASYQLTCTITIGREGEYVTLRSEDQNVRQNTQIRNGCICRQPHAKITLNHEVVNASGKMINRKQCFIEDSSSRGTAVNRDLLRPNEVRQLRNEDKITLSPNSQAPLVIVFKETVHGC